MNIRYYRQRIGLTQSEVAKRIGVSPSAYAMYERGEREPNIDTIYRLANIFDTSIDALCGKKPPNKHVVPVLGKVAAGLPIEAVEDILDYEELSPALLKDGGEYFALQIKGDSMEPRICEGDVVIVRKQDTLDSGEVGIVCVNGENATCKKVIISEAGVTLLPYNTKHLPMIYTAEQVKTLPVAIIGKVVELRAKF
jgi:repressor LexA